MSEHTPGPWSWDGKFTVGIPHRDGDTFFRTNPEDARLIAAARDMLKELKWIAGRIGRNSGSPNFTSDEHERINAVIAKAEGSKS